MSKSVLVAVDLSHYDDAVAVARRAASLAELDGAALNVMTVVPNYGNSFVATFFDEGALEAALQKALEALHAFTEDALSGYGAVRHVVGCGNVYEEVLKAAEDVSADLIVMGASKPGATTFLLGPNAARVARHFSGSVLIHR